MSQPKKNTQEGDETVCNPIFYKVQLACTSQAAIHPTMKGNQGLDALAALCGGATKARVGNNVASAEGTTIAPTPMQNPVSHAGNVPGPTGNISFVPENMTPIASEAQQQQQQWQQAVASAATYGGVAPNAATTALLSAAAATTGLANNNGEASTLNTTMQQLAYYQYIQHAAAAAAQAAQLGNAPGVPVAQFVDPSNAAAAALALSGQQNEVKLGEFPSVRSVWYLC